MMNFFKKSCNEFMCVYQVVKLFETGAYDEKETIKRLKVEKLFDQILFHTDNALKYLEFISSKEVIVNG